MRPILKGSTDQSVILRIVDSSDGTPETGVVYNTSGIDLWYRREGAAKVSITEATLSALTDAHSDGGVLHIGDGYYRLDLPDAAVASGANGVAVGGTVTGMIVIGAYVPLTNFDFYDAVRGGLTALPNAAAEASGGLPTLSAAQASNGTINANVHRWLTGTPNALQSGRVDSYLGAVASGVIAAASFAANALDAVWSTTTRVLTAATNLTTALATPTNITAGTITTVTTLTNAPSDSSGTTTLLSRLSSARAGYLDNLSAGAVALASTFSGITSLAQWLGLIAGKQTGNSTARTELRATGAGSGTYDETTDSQEAARDNMGTAQTGDAFARLGAPAGASVSADVAAVKVDTAAILVDTGTTLDARIPSALVSGRMDVSVGAMATGVVTASAIAADAIGASELAADAVAEIADAVWDELQSGHTTTGTFGKYVDASISGVSTGGVSAGDIADAVWDEAIAAHSGGAGSAAEALAAAAAGGGASAAAIADAVLDEALSGHTTAGTLGQAVADILVDTGTTLQGELDGIQADTEDIQSRLPVALVSGRIDASVGGMASDVVTSSALAASAVSEIQSGLSTLDAAAIRTAIGLGSANVDTQLAAINALVTAIQGYVDTEVAAIKAKTDGLPSDPADASDIAASFSSLASTLSTIAGYLDTEVAAIKTQTDKLTFDGSNNVAANVEAINAVALTGAGTSVSPWGPA